MKIPCAMPALKIMNTPRHAFALEGTVVTPNKVVFGEHAVWCEWRKDRLFRVSKLV
jgi:hypothetical protein